MTPGFTVVDNPAGGLRSLPIGIVHPCPNYPMKIDNLFVLTLPHAATSKLFNESLRLDGRHPQYALARNVGLATDDMFALAIGMNLRREAIDPSESIVASTPRPVEFSAIKLRH